jgi:hypothetical protein
VYTVFAPYSPSYPLSPPSPMVLTLFPQLLHPWAGTCSTLLFSYFVEEKKKKKKKKERNYSFAYLK